MTVAELLKRTSSRELTEWMAFGQLEPFGSRASYYGQAIIAATVANVYRKKGSKAYTAEDFIPRFTPPKAQTTEEMIEFAAMMTQALGGQDLRERDEVENGG